MMYDTKDKKFTVHLRIRGSKMKIGDSTVFIDTEGVAHQALVTHIWGSSVNIAYVDPENGDSFGNSIIRETSVPLYQLGMSGFYVKGQ